MAEDATDPLLRVENLKKYYTSSSTFLNSVFGKGEIIKAVDNVSVDVAENEVFGIVGESGSGKSTLGDTILRLEEPTDGRILFKGEDIAEFSPAELRQFRREAQIISQDPYEGLNPRQTVYQIISEPLRNFYDYDRSEMVERVEDLLDDVGLRPAGEFTESYPSQLSGGQRQRVNIARALVLEPDLLIADEPLSMLDVSIQSNILALLEDLRVKYELSIIYISHNIAVVSAFSDAIGVMFRGKIVEQGVADRITTDPKHPYTRALIESIPDPSIDRKRIILPEKPLPDGDHTGCGFYVRCPDAMDKCFSDPPALDEADGREVACFLHHDSIESQV